MNIDWKRRYTFLRTPWQHFRKRGEIISLVLILLLAIAVWPVPQWMVRHEYWKWSTDPNGYAKLVDDYRKTFVQIIGGAFLLYTLYLTQRRTKATEETLRLTQKTLEITRETQITDRFTKAITQLGATDSQGRKQIETRLGAIYALERIAKDSPDDHWPIMEILTAYIRQNTAWQAPNGDFPLSGLDQTDKDIQAIITVLTRRKHEFDRGALDLSQSDLRNIHISKANLRGAIFELSHLGLMLFVDVDLEGAIFLWAHMREAKFENVNLRRAMFDHADLRGAAFAKCPMEEATFQNANLSGTCFFNGVLNRANLKGVDLSQANIFYPDVLSSAAGDHITKLPPQLTHPDHWPQASSQEGEPLR